MEDLQERYLKDTQFSNLVDSWVSVIKENGIAVQDVFKAVQLTTFFLSNTRNYENLKKFNSIR